MVFTIANNCCKLMGDVCYVCLSVQSVCLLNFLCVGCGQFEASHRTAIAQAGRCSPPSAAIGFDRLICLYEPRYELLVRVRACTPLVLVSQAGGSPWYGYDTVKIWKSRNVLNTK